MIAKFVAAAGFAALATGIATADPLPSAAASASATATLSAARSAIPAQLTPEQRSGYRAVFAAIREQRWQDAQLGLAAMAPGPLHSYALAELYTAKGSPRVELDALVKLLTEAPELPQAEALTRLARARGATDLPPLPGAQRLIWQDGAPNRIRAKATRSDQIAATLAAQMQPYVKADMGREAEALLDSTSGLTPEAQTEWTARVAWIYFLQGLDADARRLGDRGATGYGDWAVQARWTSALSAWRTGDCAAAANGFEGVSTRAGDIDLRAAGLYWAARADMRCGRPDRVEPRLKNAAQYREAFYGQLARQALGMTTRAAQPERVTADWAQLERRPNVRVAAALVEVGENEAADQVIRQQARIGAPNEFAALIRVTEQMDLPASVVWLAHNCPQGVTATAEARYPTPNWTPDTGWRVDKALVWAHTLQESGFRNKVVSAAGAYGLMQIMPAAATDYMRERGMTVDRTALTRPSTNVDIGQRHLEKLRDMGLTQGLLPKVIAAYNAGPKPVQDWNALVHDGGDPLLYIESIPYWETRGYVTIVLRNYWMYEAQAGRATSASRAALAQGLWPRFPGLPGPSAVRIKAPTAQTAIAVDGRVGAASTTVSPGGPSGG
ncbi:lytic transglycosylase domain-containing protein [Sphingomonas lycopersici]|uniref:lytic transglycosylase domain-containing protein n=1 Tax=Sphingomonas lycopersici TaxID=2951807 RepID=UPI003D7B7EDC